jgi:hypothetical protein
MRRLFEDIHSLFHCLLSSCSDVISKSIIPASITSQCLTFEIVGVALFVSTYPNCRRRSVSCPLVFFPWARSIAIFQDRCCLDRFSTFCMGCQHYSDSNEGAIFKLVHRRVPEPVRGHWEYRMRHIRTTVLTWKGNVVAISR